MNKVQAVDISDVSDSELPETEQGKEIVEETEEIEETEVSKVKKIPVQFQLKPEKSTKGVKRGKLDHLTPEERKARTAKALEARQRNRDLRKKAKEMVRAQAAALEAQALAKLMGWKELEEEPVVTKKKSGSRKKVVVESSDEEEDFVPRRQAKAAPKKERTPSPPKELPTPPENRYMRYFRR